jgi:hypothetical protein
MIEIVGNLHLHTIASDGTGTHDEVASAAARAGLDFIIYTDHNIWVDGVEDWYHDPDTGRTVLRLMGQEVNDQNLDPELNHLLCYFAPGDLNGFAAEPQRLIHAIIERNGLCFLAHPLERPGYGEAAQIYPWISWDISDYTGIELWNAMTDVKWSLRTLWPRAIFGAFFPQWVLNGPFPELLAKWDELLATGQKVVAIGSSDAHAMSFSWGPLTRMIYSYEYLFKTVNTHIFLNEPLAAEVETARLQIYSALQQGHCFAGYDLIASPRGFTFTGSSAGETAIMGDSLRLQGEAILRINSPQPARLRLLKDGQPIVQRQASDLTWRTTEPGVYRVEAYRRFWGLERGWVFTNPIYLVGR